MIEIVAERNRISVEDLQALCIRSRWFTCGSYEQYQKLFDMADVGAPLEELALVIWLCSRDVTREGVLQVLADEFGGKA